MFSNTHDLTMSIKTILQKKQFNQPISLVDVWGECLGNILFGDPHPELYLSSFRQLTLSGQYPFPIFTAIIPAKINKNLIYDWVEFNPFEMNLEDYHLDVKYCNSFWVNGKLVKEAPEPSLSQMMGIFSSAFSVNFDDIMRLFGTNYYQKFLLNQIKNLIQKFELSNLRLTQGRLLDPFYHSNSNKSVIDLFDAGISYNCPILPLLQRQSDIIIYCEASESDVNNLSLMTNYITEQGYPFPNIDFDNFDKDIPQIFHHNQTPSFIFIPNTKIYSTFKLQYTPEEFDDLYNSMYETTVNFLPKIIDHFISFIDIN